MGFPSRLKHIADQKEMWSSLESMSSDSSETDSESESESSSEDDGVRSKRSSFIGKKRRKNRSRAAGSRTGWERFENTDSNNKVFPRF